MTTKLLAWHFLPDDGYTANGEHIKVEPGQTLKVNGDIALCAHGYHWSIRALDALDYAPGFIVQRVEVSGKIIEDDDKGVSSERKCLWLFDARDVILEFACRAAEYAFEQLKILALEPDPRSIEALRVVRAFIAGAVTLEDVRAARAAADAAADAAAYAARAELNTVLETMLEAEQARLMTPGGAK